MEHGNQEDTKKMMEERNELKVLYTNADMLMNKLTELKEICKLHWPDIIGINEVKYKNMKDKKLKTAEFTINKQKYDIFENNVENDRGRGQLLHIDKRLKAEEIEMKTPVDEVLAVRLKLNKKENMIITLVYRSPTSSETNNIRICQAINEVCREQERHIIIMGDFNYKEINWEKLEGKGERQEHFLECIQENYLHQKVKECTRFRGTGELPGRHSNTNSGTLPGIYL
jgi:hypothetical protein